jgi:hypothetical protein
VHNPWPIIGGVAQAIVTDSEFILPELGQAGDVRDQRALLLPRVTVCVFVLLG